MTVTPGQVMRHCNNYFERCRTSGVYSVTGGAIPALPLPAQTWLAVESDPPYRGVWQTDASGAVASWPDGTLSGVIRYLDPPEDFLNVCAAIAEWAENDRRVRSETCGQTSRTLACGSDGLPVCWQNAFRTDLIPWRRMYTDVRL